MFSFFNSIPQVTKNILLLNIMFFVVTMVLDTQGINLKEILGAHYVTTQFFQPFQIVTHFFMHDGFLHIFFNMWLFVMLGGFLEQLWGAKRFFIFYIACAMGGFVLYNAIGIYEIQSLKEQLISMEYNLDDVDSMISNGQYLKFDFENNRVYHDYLMKSVTPMVGASGAIFGIMVAFAILFPNTEFMLYFAIPVKAKYLVGAYFLFEVYQAFQNQADDPVAHLAHIGGAIVGGVLVLIWRKQDRSNFW